MAGYLLQLTKALVPTASQMPELAHDLVPRGLYGIRSTPMLRHRIRPGDLMVATVGSPHRVFVADAPVESGYHCFDEEERARRPGWMNLDHGIGLRDVHVWSAPMPIMFAWPTAPAGETANKRALFYGTLIILKPADDAAILAAADRAAGSVPVTPTGEKHDRATLRRAGMARPAVPVVYSTPVTVDPEEAATRVRRALALAEDSPPWLPNQVAPPGGPRRPSGGGIGRAARWRLSSLCTFDLREQRSPARRDGTAGPPTDDAAWVRLPDRTPARIRHASRRGPVRQLAVVAAR